MFERELSRLSEGFRDRERKVGTRVFCLALLTKGNGRGELLVENGKPREIWVRRSDTRELFTCYLPPNPSIVLEDGHTEYEAIEVRVGYIAESDQLQVLDQLSLGGQRSIGTTSPMEALLYQAFYTTLDNFANLRPRPTSPVTSNDVYVDGPYAYSQPSSGKFAFFSGGSVGVAVQTAITAIAAGKHQLGIVYLDKETNTLGITLGTAVTATGSLPSRSEFTTSDVSAIIIKYHQEAIVPVYLYFNQASVEESDLFRTWDLRQIFSRAVARPAEKIYLHTTYSGLGGLLGGALGA